MYNQNKANCFEIFHGRVQQPVNAFLLEIFTLIVENIVDNLLSTGWRLISEHYVRRSSNYYLAKRFCECMQTNKYVIYHLWSVRTGEIFFLGLKNVPWPAAYGGF